MRTRVTAIRTLAAPAITIAAVVGPMAVHTIARGTLWRHEWLWAAYQYHLGLVIAGLVAGILGVK